MLPFMPGCSRMSRNPRNNDNMKARIEKIRNESGDLLLNKEELAVCLNLTSTRTIENWMRRRIIPFIPLGHRTVRFQPRKVYRALEQLEVRAV